MHGMCFSFSGSLCKCPIASSMDRSQCKICRSHTAFSAFLHSMCGFIDYETDEFESALPALGVIVYAPGVYISSLSPTQPHLELC